MSLARCLGRLAELRPGLRLAPVLRLRQPCVLPALLDYWAAGGGGGGARGGAGGDELGPLANARISLAVLPCRCLAITCGLNFAKSSSLETARGSTLAALNSLAAACIPDMDSLAIATDSCFFSFSFRDLAISPKLMRNESPDEQSSRGSPGVQPTAKTAETTTASLTSFATT